jgi:hypothetical protein
MNLGTVFSTVRVILVASLVSHLAGCCCAQIASDDKHSTAVANLYAFDYVDMHRHLAQATGLKIDFSGYDVFRSADGSAVYAAPFRRATGPAVVIQSARESHIFNDLHDSQLPRELRPWYAEHRVDIPDESTLRFHNGQVLRFPKFTGVVADVTGEYFVLSSEGKTTIAKPGDPNRVLARVAGDGRKLYLKTGKAYLFADDWEYYRTHQEAKELLCYLFRTVDSGLELERVIRIPRPQAGPSPFAVVDMDPWSDNVLLIDIRDPPVRSRWLLFNLASGASRPLGYAKAYGFFLRRDVFAP